MAAEPVAEVPDCKKALPFVEVTEEFAPIERVMKLMILRPWTKVA